MNEDYPVYSKRDLARVQLERAITLYLDEHDNVSAITLAGAAEEILGKLLTNAGGTPSVKAFAQALVAIGKEEHGETWQEKDFVSMDNYFRDNLKHITSGEDIIVPPFAAKEIIERAIENYLNVTGTYTDAMVRFIEVGE